MDMHVTAWWLRLLVVCLKLVGHQGRPPVSSEESPGITFHEEDSSQNSYDKHLYKTNTPRSKRGIEDNNIGYDISYHQVSDNNIQNVLQTSFNGIFKSDNDLSNNISPLDTSKWVRPIDKDLAFGYDIENFRNDEESQTQGAPKYMLDLYDKFSKDRYSHPLSNIVRSFKSVAVDDAVQEAVSGNETRVHTLTFNMTSVGHDEDIYLAELRLYTLVEADRVQYYGADRKVTVNEVRTYDWPDGTRDVEYHKLASREIYGHHSGWETFPMTDAVKQWVSKKTSMQVLEVKIESVHQRVADHIKLDIDTRKNNENEPLLVVFSNSKSKKKSSKHDLKNLLQHELDIEVDPEVLQEMLDYEYDDYNYDDKEYYTNEISNSIQKRDIHGFKENVNVTNDKSYEEFEYIYDQSDYANMIEKRDTDHSKITKKHRFDEFITNKLQNLTNATGISLDRKEKLAELYRQVLDVDSTVGKAVAVERTRRSKLSKSKKLLKKRRFRKKMCRRKPMYVNFADIKWDGWIIAPKGYQAYECTGRCYYPLSDHLTPTNHAIIQTLLHTTNKKKASRACCVPTRLDPISILYIDEKGVVTYKYKYEDMIVAECGCR